MSEKQSTRRNFLQFLGLTAGTTLVSTSVFAGIVTQETIHQLKPEQQEFMIRYGKWMDEFIEVIRIQKTNPENIEYLYKMVALTEKVEKFQPELDEFMKDEKFAIIYSVSIKRVSEEI